MCYGLIGGIKSDAKIRLVMFHKVQYGIKIQHLDIFLQTPPLVCEFLSSVLFVDGGWIYKLVSILFTIVLFSFEV